jgi:predicted RNA-binding protein YlqC (UPF0109 family)
MSSIDQQFVEYIVKSLVNSPDAVKVERTIDEKGVLLELTVDPEDLGRVIGKRGATAQSLRTLLRALGTKNDARYNLKIVDVGGERPARSSSPRDDSFSQDDSSSDDSAGADDTTADDKDDLGLDDEEKDTSEEKSSSRLDKTRRELADLDDLDV